MDSEIVRSPSHHGSPLKEAVGQWIAVVLFAIAFAWVESAIVVYLREIYFAGSFAFPLVLKWGSEGLIVDLLLRIELGREAATIIMLALVGWMAAKNGLRRFCYFMIAFGIWDIFYYIWLRVMVGWPESLMTWDLLFAIPLPWVGPVIAPVIISVAMIVAGTFIIYYSTRDRGMTWRWFDWAVELGLAVLMVVAFCWDWKNIMRIPDGVARSGVPNPFAWWFFAPVYVTALVYFIIRLRQIVSGRD